MSTINPNLASAALSMQNLQSNSSVKFESKSDERSSDDSRNSANVNDSVTLSAQLETQTIDYLALNRQQTVNNSDSVENRQNETAETNNGLTYSSNLQTQSNYLAKQPDSIIK